MRLAILLTVALASSGCGLLFDPCGDLDERLCADLGSEDCAVFRSNSSIYESVIPHRRRKVERSMCEMLVDDSNYASYTLPYVRHQIAVTRDPRTRAPELPSPQPVDGLASGFGSWFLCCVPVVVIPFILFIGWRSRRQLAAAQASGSALTGSAHAGPGTAPTPGAPPSAPVGWAHVDSASAVEAQVASGALVAVERIPAAAGGQPGPQNVLYLPPALAQRKRELDAQASAMIQRGEASGYAAEPEYRGSSFVPARVRLVVHTAGGPQSQLIEVW